MAALGPNTTVPHPSQAHLDRGYDPASLPNSVATDFGATPGNLREVSPLSQSAAQQNLGKFNEEWEASVRGSSIIDGNNMQRSNSVMSQGDTLIPSRGGTLKKKASIRRGGSLKRSSSRRSSRAGSVRSLALQPGQDVHEMNSAFFSPVPTTGNPTEILANRFQAWRKILKDLITYFREIQTSYEHRGKSLLKVANIINNTSAPPGFLESGGIDDAAQVLRTFHKTSIAEANKSREIENDVIAALGGLRQDLQQKIKEIKNLSGDFKNSVEKEMEATRRAVNDLQDGLGQSDIDPAQNTGRKDPYLLKLAVDRQVEKQIDEENYLHQAYLNLEASGRELEAIVVGEIQKSYNAFAGILKREADAAYNTVDELRTGPIAMPKDHEWSSFIKNDDHFVDPDMPVREADLIHYPGKNNELAQEVRAGLLERKSKYLKSYTAGWYVLSPTHLHEFKSADKNQAPIMSLYLPEQKLGSHSTFGASSNKFMLKGRQTGAMHRGHSWVFRAESYETMLAWYEDIKTLTETSPQERTAFVRQHARSVSGTSQRAGSISSDGIVDEEDDEPFSGTNSGIVNPGPKQDVLSRRPQPGGRFPSDIAVDTLSTRGLHAPLSPSSGSSGFGDVQDRNVAAASALPGSGIGRHYAAEDSSSPTHAALVNQEAERDGINPYTSQPIQQRDNHNQQHHNFSDGRATEGLEVAGAGAGGAALGAAGIAAYHAYKEDEDINYRQQQQKQAARDAVTIAAPNTLQDRYAEQAAREAATISAPDTAQDLYLRQAVSEAAVIAAPDATDSDHTTTHIMSGGRSQGDLSQNDINTIETTLESVTNSRPLLPAGESHQSVQTISQLHVPGEYPKDIVRRDTLGPTMPV